MATKAHVVVDYQNIHLTGHELYCQHGEAKHLCLIHPLHYALHVVQNRNRARQIYCQTHGESFEQIELETVHTYRGLPSNRHAAKQYQRSVAQQSEWTRDARSIVVYRPLKYYSEPNGSYTVKEKGIDVLVALQLIIQAAGASKDGTIVILAAHDTDQEPALELANQLAPGRIETTGWRDGNRLRAKGSPMWHTGLNEQGFLAVRDTKLYT